MDTFRARHADILAQQPRVLALLREHGLVTFTGITGRTELARVARRLMSIRPHRDAGPDGVTVSPTPAPQNLATPRSPTLS